jgi:hypothetical protein
MLVSRHADPSAQHPTSNSGGASRSKAAQLRGGILPLRAPSAVPGVRALLTDFETSGYMGAEPLSGSFSQRWLSARMFSGGRQSAEEARQSVKAIYSHSSRIAE